MVWLTSSYNHKGKSKVQTEHKTQINTSPRNKTKTKGNPITNHQLTTAILFLLFYPYHNFLTPNFRSFYISFFLIIYPSSSSLFIFSVKFIHSFGSVKQICTLFFFSPNFCKNCISLLSTFFCFIHLFFFSSSSS